MSESGGDESNAHGDKPGRSSLDMYSHPAVEFGEQWLVNESQLQLFDQLTLLSMRGSYLRQPGILWAVVELQPSPSQNGGSASIRLSYE